MKKLFAYLEKIGADFRPEKYGNNYFFNAPGVVFSGAVVCFEFFDRVTVTKWHDIEKKIERYAARYGYEIFSRGGYLGCAWFSIARAVDLERYSDYRVYMDACVSECEKIAHEHYTGRHVVQDLNAEMRRVMDEYGNNYMEFLKAVNAA